MKLRLFSPILVAIFAVVSLYAANAARLPWTGMFYPMIVGLFVSLFFIGIFSLHPRTSKSMPLIASVFTFACLIWYMITPYAGAAVMLVVLLIGMRKKLDTRKFEKGLAILLIGAIIICSGQALWVNLNKSNSTSSIVPIADAGAQPNIYFIVPDRMPSPVSMQETGIDSSVFVDSLRAVGFYVKDNQLSHDTYTAAMGIKNKTIHSTRTMRFFASVLNDGADIPLTIPYNQCRNMITNPQIINKLHANGYTTVSIPSWFTETQNIHTDATIRYPAITFLEKVFQGEFVDAFWERTIFNGFNLKVFNNKVSIAGIERSRDTWQASTLIEFSKSGKQSQFVMAHILLPHEPYVWLSDGSAYTNISLTQVERNIAQITYTETYLENLLTQIRTNDPTAIIICQSDEGMCYAIPRELDYALSPTQWNGVFSAWYISGTWKPFDLLALQNLKHTEILKYLLER